MVTARGQSGVVGVGVRGGVCSDAPFHFLVKRALWSQKPEDTAVPVWEPEMGALARGVCDTHGESCVGHCPARPPPFPPPPAPRSPGRGSAP